MTEEIKFYPMPPMSRAKWWCLFFLFWLSMPPTMVIMLFVAGLILPIVGLPLLALVANAWKGILIFLYVIYPFMGKKIIASTQEKKLIKELRKYRKQRAAIIKREGTAEQYLLAKHAAKRKNITLGEAKKFYWEQKLDRDSGILLSS